MSNLRQTFKQIIPRPIWQAGRKSWHTLGHAALWPAAALHPWRRASIEQLTRLKDIHRGERCFIIGNGPSLKQTDLTRLKNEFSFGTNRIYLAFVDWGFTTSYFLSINSLVIEQCAQEMVALDLPKFLAWRSHRHFANLESVGGVAGLKHQLIIS